MGIKRPLSETERIRRMLIGMFIIVLLIISSLIAVGVYALRDVQLDAQNYVNLKLGNLKVVNGKDGLSIVGEQGPQGVAGESIQGPKGDQGDKGDTGNVGTNGEAIVGQTGEKGEKGDKGNTGEQGPEGQPGKTIFTRYNPLTGQEECKYEGDRDWMECEA